MRQVYADISGHYPSVGSAAPIGVTELATPQTCACTNTLHLVPTDDEKPHVK